MEMINWDQARRLVSALRGFKKVYGTFTPRKINGINAEYSLMVVDSRGQHWHFFTGDMRHGKAYATIRKTNGPKDFTGGPNNTIATVDNLRAVMARMSA